MVQAKRKVSPEEFQKLVSKEAYRRWESTLRYYEQRDWDDAVQEFKTAHHLCKYALVSDEEIRPIAKRLYDERKASRTDQDWHNAERSISYDYEVEEPVAEQVAVA